MMCRLIMMRMAIKYVNIIVLNIMLEYAFHHDVFVFEIFFIIIFYHVTYEKKINHGLTFRRHDKYWYCPSLSSQEQFVA